MNHLHRASAIALIPVILLSSCGKQPEEIKTETIKRPVHMDMAKSAPFTEEIKLVGRITADKETAISSQTSGTIKTIKVGVGDSVKAGQILAEIDFSTSTLGASLNNAAKGYENVADIYASTKISSEKDLENARIALENARMNKENTYKSTDKQLALAQTQLDNVITQKKNLKTTSGIGVELAQKSSDNAALALENFEKNATETLRTLNDNKSGIETSLIATMDSSISSFESALYLADSILGLTPSNRTTNDSFETFLGAKNTEQRYVTERAFEKANVAFTSLRGKGSKVELVNDYVQLAESCDVLYRELVTTLNNSAPNVQIDSYKVSIATKQATLSPVRGTFVSLSNQYTNVKNSIASTTTNMETQRLSLQTAVSIGKTNFENAKAGTVSSLESVDGSETLIKNQLESTLAQIQSSRDSVDNAVKIAEAQYESSKAKIASSLSSTKNQLDASKGQKDIAGIQFQNGYIKAPFDGIVLSKNVEVGSLINMGTVVFSIGTGERRIVKTDINAENASALSVGQAVTIGFRGKTHTGTISVISPSTDSATKLAKIEIVSANLTEALGGSGLGEFADIFVTKTASDKNAIAIPFSALVSNADKTYKVFVVGSGSVVQSKKVRIGDQNARLVEIISGLNEGDTYVERGALTIDDGDTVMEEATK